ncbi:glycosyltransferase [Microbacterium sp. LRZ72]|uniref:glycosyltransferase family 2 protein n=1 Tax=Microbacterium sp. LRZ72 TaxID=2942481 RepID=UPI0029AAB1D6|nr:glycosyltransferase [Microbacterium sp. LRZ72]MDX2377467.1 glycosyltransferase [Microbacterium sp. LRZ72]
MTPDAARSVAVTVPTFRRTERLDRLLPELLAHARESDGIRVRVIVVDNDPAQSARGSAERRGVDYVAEPRRGLSAVRNRAIEAALAASADALVFIDDDEMPSHGWLRALTDPWLAGFAEIVAGEVVSTFDTALDPWIEAGGFFRRVRFAEGEHMAAAPTNNLLLDLATVERLGLRFDERFAGSGGEDIFFTRQARAGGARIVSAPAARVSDPVPADRLTRRWVLLRAFRVGTTTVRGDVLLAADRATAMARRVRWGAAGLLRTVVGVARALWGRLTRSVTHDARGMRLAARGAGMTAGALGLHYREYSRREKAGRVS